MKLESYTNILKMGKKKVAETLIPVKVNKALKQGELEMCKLDEKIAVKQADIQEACTKDDLDFAKIIDMQDELALLERKKKQYDKILSEMFGTTDTEEEI
ncbi:hypothetical protein OAO19_03010 [Gammaproteobacteria bacterium]|nr:hypothetical protein [Gammaproteobacteria bacterium]